MRILALDVGNTTVGAALFDEQRGVVEDSVRFPVDRALEGDAIVDWVARGGARHAVLGSVGEAGGPLQARLEPSLESLLAFHRGDQFPMSCDVGEPARVGVDRLAACLGAHSISGAGALVVDLGTAITVDWVDAGGTFRGGAIVPGRRLCAGALHQFTDRLPDVGAPEGAPVSLPGRSPEDAIRAGLDRGLPGLVEALIEDLEAAAGGAVEVWITGGDAGWLAARSRRSYRHEPHLVLRGLLEAWRRRVAS